MNFTEATTKLASGRYCLALIAGVVFVIAAITGQLDSKDIIMILIIVFQSYFNRPRTPEDPTHG